MNDFGNFMWIICSLVAIPALFIRFYRISKGTKSEEDRCRKKTLVWIDIFRNILEVIMGFFFVYSHLVGKMTVGAVAIMVSSLGLIRFDFL